MKKKSSLYGTILMIWVVASLFAFVGHSVFPSGGSLAVAAFLQEEEIPTPTPTLTPTPTPAPILKIIKERSPDLVEDLDGDGTIDPGDTIEYTITYENIGDAEATKVTIVDDYDQDYIDSIANISDKGKDDEDTITWDVGTVQAKAKGSVTYEARLDIGFSGGPIVMNTATINSEETDPVEVTESTPVKGPILTIDKKRAAVLVRDLNGNGKPDPGDIIKYIITYENISDVQAIEVVLVDDYDQDYIESIANISADGRDNEDTITWNLTPVAAGAKDSASYDATLKSVFPPGPSNVENKATISGDNVETASDKEPVLVEVIPTPTPTPAPTFTPVPTAAPTPSTLKVQATIAQGEGPLSNTQITILLAMLLVGGLVVVGFMAFQTLTSDQAAKDREHIRCLIEGVILVVIFFSIIVLALHNAIERDGVISIVSAIVGYMLGRRAAR